MCCLLCSNNNNRSSSGCFGSCSHRPTCGQQTVIQGARGPIGPQGATGPIGPQGPSGTNDGIYANSGATTVNTNQLIPLTLTTATPTSTMSVSSGAVNTTLNGTYLVSYFINGSTTGAPLIVTLYINGVATTSETLTFGIDDNNNVVGSKTILLTLPANSTLALYNTSTNSANVLDASITAVRIA